MWLALPLRGLLRGEASHHSESEADQTVLSRSFPNLAGSVKAQSLLLLAECVSQEYINKYIPVAHRRAI